MRSRSLELPAAASPLPLLGAPCGATVEGTIAQVFRTGFYVRIDSAVLPVLGPGALPLPTGVRCPGLDASALARLAAGAPVTVQTDSAGLVRGISGSGLTLTARRTWRPARVGALRPVRNSTTAGKAVAARAGTPGLLPRGLGLVAALDGGHGLGSTVRPALRSAVHDLLGFGPGSTPSGDDLLCGAALALRGLGELGALGTLRDHLPAHLLYERTSALSASLVSSALDGYRLPQVATALDALARGDVGAALAAVEPIGHSSGFDLLLGAALVLGHAASPPGPPGPPVRVPSGSLRPSASPPISRLRAVPV